MSYMSCLGESLRSKSVTQLSLGASYQATRPHFARLFLRHPSDHVTSCTPRHTRLDNNNKCPEIQPRPLQSPWVYYEHHRKRPVQQYLGQHLSQMLVLPTPPNRSRLHRQLIPWPIRPYLPFLPLHGHSLLGVLESCDHHLPAPLRPALLPLLPFTRQSHRRIPSREWTMKKYQWTLTNPRWILLGPLYEIQHCLSRP